MTETALPDRADFANKNIQSADRRLRSFFRARVRGENGRTRILSKNISMIKAIVPLTKCQKYYGLIFLLRFMY